MLQLGEMITGLECSHVGDSTCFLKFALPAAIQIYIKVARQKSGTAIV